MIDLKIIAIVWRDYWANSWGLAVDWRPWSAHGRNLFSLGFNDPKTKHTE